MSTRLFEQLVPHHSNNCRKGICAILPFPLSAHLKKFGRKKSKCLRPFWPQIKMTSRHPQGTFLSNYTSAPLPYTRSNIIISFYLPLREFNSNEHHTKTFSVLIIEFVVGKNEAPSIAALGTRQSQHPSRY
jgi:hypothetical protein